MGSNTSVDMPTEGDRVPWLRRRAFKQAPNALVQLHNEVLDLCDLLAPTKAEKGLRDTVTKLVRARVSPPTFTDVID